MCGIKQDNQGISLVVQWLRFHTPNVGSLGSVPSQETRSYMLQSSLYAATKAPNNQINKLKEPKKTQTALTPSAFQKLEFSN